MQINSMFEACATSQPKHGRILSCSGAKDTFEKELAGAQEHIQKPGSMNKSAVTDKDDAAPEPENCTGTENVSKNAAPDEKEVVSSKEPEKQEEPETDNVADDALTAVKPEKTREEKTVTAVVVVNNSEPAAAPVIAAAPAEIQVAMAMVAQPASAEAGELPVPVDVVSLPATDGDVVTDDVSAGTATDGNALPIRPAAVLQGSDNSDEKGIMPSAPVKPKTSKTTEQTAGETRVSSEETGPKEKTYVPVDFGKATETVPAEHQASRKQEMLPDMMNEPVVEEVIMDDNVVPVVAARDTKENAAPGTSAREIAAAAMPLPEAVTIEAQDEAAQTTETPSSKRRNSETQRAAVSNAAPSADPAALPLQAVDQAVKAVQVNGQARQENSEMKAAEKRSQRLENVVDAAVNNDPQQQNVASFIPSVAATRPEQAAAVKEVVLPAPASPDVNALIGQIVKQARITVQNNRSEMVIRLQPEHLGTLNMSIVTEGNSVHIRIQVDNKSVKDMLESNISQLTGSLNGQGMKVDGLGITIAPRPADTVLNFNGFGWGGMLGNGASSEQNSWSRFSENYVPGKTAGDEAAREYRSVPAGLAGRLQGSAGSVDYLV